MRDWQTDFAIFDENGQLTAIAEAKSQTNRDESWASAWLRNFSEHQTSPMPLFVLLATPETLYIWKRRSEQESFKPIATTDTRRLLSSYFNRPNYDTADLLKPVFEFVIGAWLDGMAHGLWEPSDDEDVRALVDTGLLEAMRNGRVTSSLAA